MYVADDFYDGVLQDIAAPATANTLQLCRDWQRFEGGSAQWNPWNTTQRAPGSWDYNSAGVQNFPDEQTGIEATVITLRNGYYPSVVAAFQRDLPETQWGLDPAIINEINLWGTHGFAGYLQSIAASSPPPPPPPPGSIGAQKRVIILDVENNGGQWLLSGSLCVQLQSPDTVASFVAAGVPQAHITAGELSAIRGAAAG